MMEVILDMVVAEVLAVKYPLGPVLDLIGLASRLHDHRLILIGSLIISS